MNGSWMRIVRWCEHRHFFLTDQYVIYDYGLDRVRDGARPLSEFPVGAASGFPESFALPGPATGLDTGLLGKGPYAEFAYFFRGTDYMRVRNTPGADSFDPANGRPISVWNIPASYTAFNGALNRDAYCYFFRDSEYMRYIWAEDRIDSACRVKIRSQVKYWPAKRTV